jgi:hypothetical protein
LRQAPVLGSGVPIVPRGIPKATPGHPIRQVVRGENEIQRRYLVIAPGTVGNLGAPVQVQSE